MNHLLILSMGILAVQAGPNDNVEDLKVALGNLDMNHSFLYAPVEVIEGEKKNYLNCHFAS